MAKASFSTFTFGDIMVKQSQNTARLGFEVRFQSLKRRLDIELNEKKQQYNEMDKTLEPVLAGLKRERALAETEKNKLSEYLSKASSNVGKVTSIINNILPKLSAAASDVGPTAANDFNSLRDQLNKALKSVQSNGYLEAGLIDKTQKIKSGANPSGLGDYASYANVIDRANAIGILLTGGEDGLQVIPGLSSGYSEKLGFARNDLTRDFDIAKNKLGTSETERDKKGNIVVDEKGRPVTKGTSGIFKKMYDLDKAIEKKDAQERLVVLKQVQAMESKHENILKSLSLSFEFSQANTEVLADRTSFLKPTKGSIMNLFI